MYKLLKYLEYLKFLIILITFIVIAITKVEIYGKLYNQYKFNELDRINDSHTVNLILLTVTGDTRYQDKKLEHLFKKLQIIHILVISGSNIAIALYFIQIFIYRKNMNSFILSLFFVYLYGRLISFPETLIRAIETVFLSSLSGNLGLRFSALKRIVIPAIFFCITYYLLDLGGSFILSATYSLVIIVTTLTLTNNFKNKVVSFLILNLILTTCSGIIFNYSSISITCISFIANIFISLAYDYAIVLAYIIYLTPISLLPTQVSELIKILFNLVLKSLNFLDVLTYNVCNV